MAHGVESRFPFLDYNLAQYLFSLPTTSKIKNGLGVSIVSTSKGIMSDNDARMKNVGGEIICMVF